MQCPGSATNFITYESGLVTGLSDTKQYLSVGVASCCRDTEIPNVESIQVFERMVFHEDLPLARRPCTIIRRTDYNLSVVKRGGNSTLRPLSTIPCRSYS